MLEGLRGRAPRKDPDARRVPLGLEVTADGFEWRVDQAPSALPFLVALAVSVLVGIALVPVLALTAKGALGSCVLLPPFVVPMAGVMVGQEIARANTPATLALKGRTLVFRPTRGAPLEVPLADVRVDPAARAVHLADRRIVLPGVEPGELEWLGRELHRVSPDDGDAEDVPAALQRLAGTRQPE
ncbi:MAG: hypothetical protein R3F61_10585 [Myxococcota bacterium]